MAIENFDQIENALNKIEIGLQTAQAESTSPPAVAAPAPAAGTEGEHKDDKLVSEKKAEEADYLFKLGERKKELDEREADLNKKAEEIAQQKKEIEETLKKLEDYRGQISAMLQERISNDSAKVDTLVQVYSNMKPQQAAKIFETMDEDLVIDILSRMKKKSAADIMNLVKAEKAQIFAERYAGYRVPASNQNKTPEAVKNAEGTKP